MFAFLKVISCQQPLLIPDDTIISIYQYIKNFNIVKKKRIANLSLFHYILITGVESESGHNRPMKPGTSNKGSFSEEKDPAAKKPTIVRLDAALKKKLKHIAIESDKSLNTIIEEALVHYLKQFQ
jgi:hypothetical protein